MSYKHKWPLITEETKKSVLSQLEREEISIYNRSGIFKVFEDAFANYVGRKYSLVVSSGTAGLHTAMVACGFSPGDEVLCPAYTFYATVTPIFQTGAVPVLCEALSNGNFDVKDAEKRITTKTKAVIVTHMWGMPCDMDKILDLCSRYGLKLLEDCSHAHGAKYKGKPIGSFGDVSIFSLQGQKIITGGEGGIVLTDDKDIYDRALLFGQYNKRCLQEISKDSKYYDYAITGFGLKLRAHPFAIAMANEQFSHLEKWHKSKLANAKYLTSKLSGIQGITLPIPENMGDEPSWYAYTFLVDPNYLRISPKQFCEELIKAGVLDADMPGSTCPLNLLKLFQKPEVLFPQYAGKIAYNPGDFRKAEDFFARAIKVPIDVDESEKYKKVLEGYAHNIRSLLLKFARGQIGQ